ncbi:hypothetical protein [Arthrobacter sp. UYCu712]|uniref:hypothetical protein n=1 Tax=Arthrobacter sp. UYCu712 TaxID=3156340 RepID=UPI0033964372
MGVRLTTAARRLLCLAALLLVAGPSVTACGPEDVPPDMSTREAFARSVMAAATSGSVEQVESLAGVGPVNVRPQAQQLVDSTRGWAPGSWQLQLSNDFPEVANIDASRDGQPGTVRYTISWSQERWLLAIGQPRNPPTGGAGPGTGAYPRAAPSTSQLPADCSDGPGHAGTVAAALECQQFTSTAGNAAGQNLYWLTSTPLHVGFDRLNGSATVVVRMPCGVFNVPVSVDAFGLTPDPAGLVESADSCTGTDAEQRSWTTAYFKSPMIYQLNAQELVLSGQLGQIRFARD